MKVEINLGVGEIVGKQRTGRKVSESSTHYMQFTTTATNYSEHPSIFLSQEKPSEFSLSVSIFVLGTMSRSLSDFGIYRSLGKGRFGYVYLVKEKSTLQFYALKVLFKTQYARDQLLWADEVRLHWLVRDVPYVLHMEDWFEDDKHVYLVLEYAAQGELFKRLPLTPERTGAIGKQLALALQGCHARGVMHRDVKPENILLTDKGEVRLADFGWASDGKALHEVCGTLDYLSPQMVRNLLDEEVGVTYTSVIDQWSFGVLLYEMLVGKAPFLAGQLAETYRKISVVELEYPVSLPPAARDLITQLLQIEESDRPSWEQVLNHTFLIS